MTTELKSRSSGWYAIVSGIIGAIAFGFLITYLKVREENFTQSILFLRVHDIGVTLQFLLMIPVVVVIHKLLQKHSPTTNKAAMRIGVGSLIATALFVVLTIPKILADVLYLFPQGIFGVWLIYVNWRIKGIVSNGLRWLGIVVGVGLTMSGVFPVGYAIFVDTIILQIPAASDEAVQKIATDTTANIILHQLVGIGLFGVVALPVWTILLGLKLLREKI